ncbi:MAG: hypothetical protein Q9221_006625 [Calogaya cf. arnoldii]
MVTVIANPMLDLIVMVIPIPMIVHLHVNKQTKLVLATIFFVSSCTIIISAVRVWATTLYQDAPEFLPVPNQSWDTVTALNLAVVEINLCVVCGSVLVLRPFCRRHLPWIVGRTRPSEPVGASPGLQFDGPSGPRSRHHYRTKVSTIGGSSSTKPRKRGAWDGLGDTLFMNDDEEDFKSLRDTELDRVDDVDGRRQRSEYNKTVNEGLAAEREKWNSHKIGDDDGTSAGTTSSTLQNTRSAGPGDIGILKTVSLDVR